jgi:hypothetical protein
LVTPKALLPSEPDVTPQVAVRIGLEELEEAARYPAELDGLVESKVWEGCKRPRSMIRTVVPVELEGRRPYKREGILWHFAPEFDDPILEAIQRARRMGDKEEESLDTHAVQYLDSLRWAEDGRAYLSMLRNMAGNESWKGLRLYIKSAARGLALNALKEVISPDRIPRYIDEEQSIYNPSWIAREYDVHVKTVQR